MNQHTRDMDSGRDHNHVRVYTLARVSGMSVDALDAMRAKSTRSLMAEILERERALEGVRNALSANLYSVIGKTADHRLRNRLLKLRRAVYHGSMPSEGQLATAMSQLPGELSARVVEFQRLLDHLDQKKADFRQSYDRDCRQTRHAFQGLIANSDFQSGLLLSSRSLSSALRQYLAAGRTELRGRAEKVERGLLRYLTRMAAKATPFSTFCAVIPGQINGDTSDTFGFRGSPRSKRSFVRLNKRLYALILDDVRENRAVRGHLRVDLNPTIRVEGARLVFLAGIKGREVFQRVENGEVVELISAMLRRHSPLSLAGLTEMIVHSPIVDVDDCAVVERYLDRLLDIGLLRLQFGIPEQEANWDALLCRLLDRTEDDHTRRISLSLKRMSRHAVEYARASPGVKAELLTKMEAERSSLLGELNQSPDASIGPVIYEDATAESAILLPFLQAGGVVVRRLVELARWASRLAWPRAEQATMRRFLDAFYDEDVRSVPIDRFYEDYYRHYFKERLEARHGAKAWRQPHGLSDAEIVDPFGVELVQTIRDGYRRLHDLIARKWADAPFAENISFTAADMEAAIGIVPSPADRVCSFSVFATPIPPSSGWPAGGLVVPGVGQLAGYGKYFSRFLYMLPGSVCTSLFEGNVSITAHRVAEIAGDSNFNANLHPRLLHWEICYPTVEMGHATEHLAMTDLDVARHSTDPNTLQLIHRPSGARVVPVDLGFMNPKMRPALYQLLSTFTPASGFGLPLPRRRMLPQVPGGERGGRVDELRDDLDRGDGVEMLVLEPRPESTAVGFAGVTYRPRIVYEDAIVIARRCWCVSGDALPCLARGEAASDYFLRVNRWRVEVGIPEQVYVKVRPVARRVPAGSRRTRAGTHAVDAAPLRPAQPPAPRHGTTQNGKAESPGGSPVRSIQDGQPTDADRDGVEQAPNARRSDHHKPQFVDFASPLLVQLFGRLGMGSANLEAIIEERLPTPDQLPTYGSERYVTELVLQVNTTALRGASR